MSLDPIMLAAFQTEILKEASRLTSMGALMGPGAALGAAVGGVGGAVRGYREAKEQGHSGAMGGLVGGLGGAQTGALVGGVGGAALGAAAPSVGGRLAKAVGDKDGVLGALTRTGQRQVHAITGHGDINALRGGSWDARKNLRDLPANASKKEFDSALDTYSAAQRGVERGLTNLPGIAKGLRRDPLGTLKDTARTTFAGASPAMKALTVGGVALGAHDAYSRAQDGDVAGAAGSAVGTAGGVLLSPVFPAISSMALGGMASKGTEKAVGYLRSKRPDRGTAIHPTESLDTQPAPEMQRTPSAMGQASNDTGSA